MLKSLSTQPLQKFKPPWPTWNRYIVCVSAKRIDSSLFEKSKISMLEIEMSVPFTCSKWERMDEECIKTKGVANRDPWPDVGPRSRGRPIFYITKVKITKIRMCQNVCTICWPESPELDVFSSWYYYRTLHVIKTRGKKSTSYENFLSHLLIKIADERWTRDCVRTYFLEALRCRL